MSKPLPLIEILRAGTFTSQEGVKVTFSDADLDAIVANYDPDLEIAPLVIGHPKTDHPAYGWVGGLGLSEGGVVLAQPTDVEPSFAEAVRAKRYRKISVSVWPANHPRNPKPSAPYLKHVGFLGAVAPAVGGLKPVSFSADDQDGCITLETPDQEQFVTKEQEQNFAERETAITTRETAIEERQRELDAREEKMRKDNAISFADGLVAATKLAPAARDKVVTVLTALDDTTAISFAEGQPQQTPAAIFRSLFDGAAPIVSLAELAPRDPDLKEGGEDDPAEIARQAQSFADEEAKAGRTITIQAAVRHVMGKG
jgi:hypothetical protein